MWGPEKQTGGEHGSKWGLCGYRCSEDAAAVTPVWSLAKGQAAQKHPSGADRSGAACESLDSTLARPHTC